MRANREAYNFSRGTKRTAKSRAEGCERCGSSSGIQCHHLIPVNYASENELPPSAIKSINNCLVVCNECHESIHRYLDYLKPEEQKTYYYALYADIVSEFSDPISESY